MWIKSVADTYEGRGSVIDIGAYSHERTLYLVTVSRIHTKGGSSLIDSDSFSHKGMLS